MQEARDICYVDRGYSQDLYRYDNIERTLYERFLSSGLIVEVEQ